MKLTVTHLVRRYDVYEYRIDDESFQRFVNVISNEPLQCVRLLDDGLVLLARSN